MPPDSTDRSDAPPGAPATRPDAVRFWSGNLDPRNLKSGVPSPSSPPSSGGSTSPSEAPDERVLAREIEREIAFAATPETEAALAWLAGAPAHAARAARGAREAAPEIAEAGAGLGAWAFLFARRGFRVLAADASPERLAALARRSRIAGVADRVRPVAALVEALPFADGSLAALHTRSTLIHVDPRRAGEEIARALAPGGRAALVEPGTGNPFAALYRRTLAPREWESITRYFDDEAIAEFREGLERGGATLRGADPFHLFGFGAFAFQFAAPSPIGFRVALRALGPLDAALFRASRAARGMAWFRVLRVERPAPASGS